MKKCIIILAIVIFAKPLCGQIISTGPNQNAGYVIWYATLSVTSDGKLGLPVLNYQAKIQTDVNGGKYLQVCNSNNWLTGTVASPVSLALYENPSSAVTVVPDYKAKQFKFYPYNTTDYSVEPHHRGVTLNFIGNDGQPYAISFSQFAGK